MTMTTAVVTLKQEIRSVERPVVDDISDLESLLFKVQQWGIARNITDLGGATALMQIAKLKKEVAELEAGLIAGNMKEVIDGIGDCLVVLVQIARLEYLSLNECLEHSWNDIKDRTGLMCCGIFVKQADLILPGLMMALKECKSAQDVEDEIDWAKARSAK